MKWFYVDCNVEAYAETANVGLAVLWTIVYLSRWCFVLENVQM
jgi:hypothetical protein